MRYPAVGTASSVRLLRPITLSQKGRICRKYISSRRIKRDGRPLHLIKPNRYDRERSRGSGNRTWVEKGMPVWNTKAGKPDIKGEPGKHDRRVEKGWAELKTELFRAERQNKKSPCRVITTEQREKIKYEMGVSGCLWRVLAPGRYRVGNGIYTFGLLDTFVNPML